MTKGMPSVTGFRSEYAAIAAFCQKNPRLMVCTVTTFDALARARSWYVGASAWLSLRIGVHLFKNLGHHCPS